MCQLRSHRWLFGLLFLVGAIQPLLAAEEEEHEAQSRQNMRLLGAATNLYIRLTGKLPAKPSDLYREALLPDLEVFVHPASRKTITTESQIDSQTDYAVATSPPKKIPARIVWEKHGFSDGQALAYYSDRTFKKFKADPFVRKPAANARKAKTGTPWASSSGHAVVKSKSGVNDPKPVHTKSDRQKQDPKIDLSPRMSDRVDPAPKRGSREDAIRDLLKRRADDRNPTATDREGVTPGPNVVPEGRDPGRASVPDAERPPSRVTYAKKRAATLFNRGEALTRQEKWPDAEAAYREAIRLDPSVAKYHDELGDVLAMQNKWADAEASFRNAVRIMPANAEYMANLGVALHKLGRAKDALATLGKAVRLDPKNHQFQNGIGLFLFDTGDWDAAAQVFRTAIKLSPTTGVYVANLGYALFQQGETEQARTLAAQARKLGTKRHALFADLQRDDDDRKRLWQLVAANRLADALTLSRKLVQQRPTDANHRLDRARLELVLGDRKVAQSEAEKMLKQYPRDTNIIELRGQVALWQNDRATAQRFFRLALEIDPQSTKYHYNDGVAFFESGTYRMAQFEFLTAVAMEPNRYYGSYYYLGAVYDQLGYPGHAIASFQTYLRYDNESESAQSARQIIARLQKTRR